MDIIIGAIKPEVDTSLNLAGISSIDKNFYKGAVLTFPINLGLIAAILENDGFDIYVIDNYANDISYNKCLEIIIRENPIYLLLTGYLGGYSYSFLKRLSKDIKKHSPNTVIIQGGPMASTIPKLILDNTDVDIVVIGEGEATISELIRSLKRNKNLSLVKGIGFKYKGKIVFTGARERITNLDTIPSPAYDLFPMDKYLSNLKKLDRCFDLSTSRGCPHGGCAFCKIVFGKKVTYMSPERVIEEMLHLNNKFGVEKFSFVNDNFFINRTYIKKFCNELKRRRLEFKWRFQARADLLNRETIKEMKSAGLFGISCGLESGSQKILSEMNKRLNIKIAEKNVKDAIKEGIEVIGLFIVGMPSEDEDTINETIEYIKRIGISSENLRVGILTPFPGTKVYEIAKRMGKISNEDAYCESLGPVYEYPYVNLTKFSDERLVDLAVSVRKCV